MGQRAGPYSAVYLVVEDAARREIDFEEGAREAKRKHEGDLHGEGVRPHVR